MIPPIIASLFMPHQHLLYSLRKHSIHKLLNSL